MRNKSYINARKNTIKILIIIIIEFISVFISGDIMGQNSKASIEAERSDSFDLIENDVYFDIIAKRTKFIIDSINISNQHSDILFIAGLNFLHRSEVEFISVVFKKDSIDITHYSKLYQETTTKKEIYSIPINDEIESINNRLNSFSGFYVQKHLTKKELRKRHYEKIGLVIYQRAGVKVFGILIVNKSIYDDKNDKLPPEKLQELLTEMLIYYDENIP